MTVEPRVWLNFLFPPVKSWERKAIESWLGTVDAETRGVGLAQLDQTNFVVRYDSGLVANFYRVSYGLFQEQISPSLDTQEPEKQVAEVCMLINKVKTKARISVVNGRIFEITFDKLPKISSRRADVAVLAVKTGSFPKNKKPDEIRASLPPDFGELEGTVDSVDDTIGVLMADQIYTTIKDGETYWMLAEKTDVGMLGIPVEGDDRYIRFLFYDGRPARRLSRSFKEAVVKARSID